MGSVVVLRLVSISSSKQTVNRKRRRATLRSPRFRPHLFLFIGHNGRAIRVLHTESGGYMSLQLNDIVIRVCVCKWVGA